MIQEFLMNYWEGMKDNEFFQAGAGVAVLSYIGYNLKPVLYWIVNRVQRRIVYRASCDDVTNSGEVLINSIDHYIKNHFSKNLRKTRYVSKDNHIDKRYGRKHPFSPIRKNQYKVEKRSHTDSFTIFYKGRFISVRKSRQMLDNASAKHESFRESYDLSSAFGKKALETFITEARREYQEMVLDKARLKEPLKISYLDDYGGTVIGNLPNKNFDNIFYDGKDELKEDLDKFIESSTKYNKLGIPMQYTLCLEGPPGTGKTSTSYAIGNYLNKSIMMVNLGEFTKDSDLITAIGEVKNGSILVWEDIDTFINGRFKSEADRTGVSFNTILNLFDGAYGLKDCINIITTNRIELFDEALVRKGRIDKIYRVDYPRIKDVLSLIDYYYSEDDIYDRDNYNELMNRMAFKEDDKLSLPMSEFQDGLLRNESKEQFMKYFLDILENGKEKEEEKE